MGRIVKNGTEYGLGGKSLIDRIYPIGSIYISTSSTFNPQNVWGGTWRKTADGRCLIGANDKYPLGSTGGEATHTLTIDEMPAHTHAPHSGYSGFLQSTKGWTNTGALQFQEDTSGKHKFYNSYNIGSTGGGKSHNNMQPYLAVYIWERIA